MTQLFLPDSFRREAEEFLLELFRREARPKALRVRAYLDLMRLYHARVEEHNALIPEDGTEMEKRDVARSSYLRYWAQKVLTATQGV